MEQPRARRESRARSGGAGLSRAGVLFLTQYFCAQVPGGVLLPRGIGVTRALHYTGVLVRGRLGVPNARHMLRGVLWLFRGGVRKRVELHLYWVLE
jgi:hypothetical protein